MVRPTLGSRTAEDQNRCAGYELTHITLILYHATYTVLTVTETSTAANTLQLWQHFIQQHIGESCLTKIYIHDTSTTTTHTHTHTFNGPLSRTTQVSQYQKGKTNLDFTAARDSEWQWHQLGHMQVCTSLQTDNHASTPPLSFYRPDALPAAQPTASKH